jgi:hypothetical protein
MYWKQTAVVTGLLLLHSGRARLQLSHFDSAHFFAVLRGFLQAMDTQFLYQIPPKLPEAGIFRVGLSPDGVTMYWWGKT